MAHRRDRATRSASRLLTMLLAMAVLGAAAVGVRDELPTPPHPSTVARAVAFLQFYAGVFTLVSLSVAVAAGLLAAERTVLLPRQRVWVQSIHRTLGVLALTFLVLHVLTEVAGHRITAVGAALPFAHTPVYLGLGSVAAYLLVAVTWTGVVRARFAGPGRPRLWRVLHSVGYICWPVALLHGLHAGRPPATWVTASYLVLLVLVGVALGLRLAADRRRRRPRVPGQVAVLAPPVPAAGQPVVAAPAGPPVRPGPPVPVSPAVPVSPPAPVGPPAPVSPRLPGGRPARLGPPVVLITPAPVGPPVPADLGDRRPRVDTSVGTAEFPLVADVDAGRTGRPAVPRRAAAPKNRRRRGRDADSDDEWYWATLRGEAR